MTRPTNPGDAIRAGAAAIAATKDAARKLSREIAAQRLKEAEEASAPTSEPTP